VGPGGRGYPSQPHALLVLCSRRKTDHDVRITWGKLRPGTWAAYEQAYHETVAGNTVAGLRGRWLAQDVQDPDGGFAVSVWKSLNVMQV